MEDDILRDLMRQKILNLRKTRGVTYKFIAENAGKPVTIFDITHLMKDDRRLGREKMDKLKEFLLINY